MTPRSDWGAPRSEWGGSYLSFDPATGARISRPMSVTSYMPEVEDDNMYLRRQLWNDSNLKMPFRPAWSSYHRVRAHRLLPARPPLRAL